MVDGVSLHPTCGGGNTRGRDVVSHQSLNRCNPSKSLMDLGNFHEDGLEFEGVGEWHKENPIALSPSNGNEVGV